MGRGLLIKGGIRAGRSRTSLALCLIALGSWAGRVLAESPKALPSDDLVETTFEERASEAPKGTALTSEEQQALWGKGVLAGRTHVASERSWQLFEGVAEQYLDAELNFAIPKGAVVSLPPRTLSLAAKGGQITVNQINLNYSRKADSWRSPGFYLIPLDSGTRLLIVRAAVDDNRLTSAALVCMNVVYEKLEGLDRLPGEDEQMPLVAQQATFSLQSLAYSSYQSGVKPGGVRVLLDKVVGFPPPVLRDDQAVGRNPSARLVYEPNGKSDPQVFGDSGIVEASSSYQLTAHAWSGDELTKSVGDSLTIRRISVDDEVRRKLQSFMGSRRRLKGPTDCIFVRWQHMEEVTRSVNKEGELHALVQRAQR